LDVQGVFPDSGRSLCHSSRLFYPVRDEDTAD
jgi:hypothetical protein